MSWIFDLTQHSRKTGWSRNIGVSNQCIELQEMDHGLTPPVPDGRGAAGDMVALSNGLTAPESSHNVTPDLNVTLCCRKVPSAGSCRNGRKDAYQNSRLFMFPL